MFGQGTPRGRLSYGLFRIQSSRAGCDPREKLLVARVGVDGGRQRTHVPRKPLRQEEVQPVVDLSPYRGLNFLKNSPLGRSDARDGLGLTNERLPILPGLWPLLSMWGHRHRPHLAIPQPSLRGVRRNWKVFPLWGFGIPGGSRTGEGSRRSGRMRDIDAEPIETRHTPRLVFPSLKSSNRQLSCTGSLLRGVSQCRIPPVPFPLK
jgi:hypothetical protein